MPYRQRSARTIRNREFLASKAVEMLRAAGAKEIARMDLAARPLPHPLDACGWATDQADSVLDPNGEARSVKRLFVADNSALPTASAGMNPTLTTQALATRTAEKIFAQYFGGEPWVGKESPCRPSTRPSRAP